MSCLLCLAPVSMTATAQGQSRIPTRPRPSTRAVAAPRGGLEGDVYLTMQSGDIKKAAGIRVYILANPDAVKADVAQRCAAWQRYLGATPNDPGGNLSSAPAMESEVDAILVRTSVADVGTGMNAHFKFDGVPVGSYLLYARFPIGKRLYGWLLPVSINAGQSPTLDLDTAAENHQAFACGWR